MSKNLSELSARKGLQNNLFENLSDPQANTPQIARDFLIGNSSVKGAVSFYDFLSEEHKQKKIYVCDGSACLCAGTQDKLKQQLNHWFEPNEIGEMTCLGRCYENSAFQYQGKNHSNLSSEQMQQLFDEASSIETPHIPSASLGTSTLIQHQMDMNQFKAQLQAVLGKGKDYWLEQIKTSQLRGRGGAGFPIGFKLQAASEQNADQKFIICNADEGDPGAYSDRFLLEQKPLLVLFGMMLASYVSGASHGILYIRGEYPESIETITNAIDRLRDHQLLGSNILESGFDFDFKVIAAQGAYICGEETALINSIEGQRPEVRTRPPFPTQQGLFNKPTVVNNVETLASLYDIYLNGGSHYASLGTDTSKGTKLVCLDSAFHKPGVYEVEMGTSLSEVFESLGGGFKTPVKAVQIGGPLGGVVPATHFTELTLDFESFQRHGFLLGHASVVSIPESQSMIEYIQHLFHFAAKESCGKCFPCRLGTKRGEELVTQAIDGQLKMDQNLLEDLLDTLEQGSLCAHGGGIPLPIKNILQHFKGELLPYFALPMEVNS